MPKPIDWKALHHEALHLTKVYTEQVGNAVTAWNLLQNFLGVLFAEIVGPANHQMARLIWYSQDSDINQQKMLRAAALGAYGEDDELYKALKWLCDKAGTLAQDRNNAVHVHYTLDFDNALSKLVFSPSGTGAWSRADHMSKRDLFAALEAVEKNAKALFTYAAELGPVIAFREQYPEPKPRVPNAWPDKPSLLKVPVLPTPKSEDQRHPK